MFSGLISHASLTLKQHFCENMASLKELLHVCEVNRIREDHLDNFCDVKIDEESIEPAILP